MRTSLINNYQKISVLLMTIILTSGLQIRAQIKQRQPIVISGTVTEEIQKEMTSKKEVLVYQEMITGTNSTLNQSYPVKFSGNKFTVSIDPIADYVYFQIQFLPVDQLGKYYLTQPGDSIYLDVISEKDFHFSSNNPLFPCQLKLNSLTAQYHSKYIKNLDTLKQQKANVIKKINHEALKYEQQIPVETIALLCVNYDSEINTSYLQRLSSSIAKKANIPGMFTENNAAQMDEEYHHQPTSNEFIIRNSINYVQYCNELEKLRSIISENSSNKKQDRFQKTFKSIQNRYSGPLREKVLTYFFLKSFTESNNAIKLLDSIINDIQDPLYKQVLLNLQKVNTSGNPAYPFSLEGIDGKKHSLTEFKDKFVFCKFWFNGCGGCARLELDLKPLKAKFINNPNIVFISINVDSDKNKWIKGIELGIYDSSHDLQLSTYPQGVQHPLIEFYHYHGFPQMLLIDKEGQIITSSPERPTNESSVMKLENLIKSYL